MSGGYLLAVFKRKTSNWGVPFQYHAPSVVSCGVMHAKRSLMVLTAGMAWNFGFGNANMVTLYTRNFLHFAFRSFVTV
jgi:hypothetical protein